MDVTHVYLDITGFRIHCAYAGSGPPVLLLHGLGASWRWWLPTIRDLVSDYTVYAADMPGAGESSPVRVLPTGDDSALIVSEILEGLGLASAMVVGHSLGGYITLQAAIRRVPAIRRIAVVDPAGVGAIKLKLFRLIGAPWIGELLQLSLSNMGVRFFLQSLVHDTKSITDEVLGWTTSSLAKKSNRDQFLFQLRLAPAIQSIDDALAEKGSPIDTIPIQIYWGRHDPLFPIDYAYHLQEGLHTQLTKVFEHSGHIPQIEEPEEFNRELRGFLNGEGGK